MTRSVELRSDTFTRPTPEMRRAMYEAEVGDDVWGEDPTVARLEELAAEITGKEAGVFVSSGTQGNLIGLLAHTKRGDEIIVGDQSHIFRYEAAGTAVCGGVQLHTIPNGADGRLSPQQIQLAVRRDDAHEPPTAVVALENSHNRCGGAVLDLAYMDDVAQIARSASLQVHVDGARIFNAAVALQTPVARLLTGADSVTFCLSKGLGAPVGSILCGCSEYIARARRIRKMLGGGMRQVGVLAAAGLFALTRNVNRLAEDHANARMLAHGLASVPGLDVLNPVPDSNMVFFAAPGITVSMHEFAESIAKRGVRIAAAGPAMYRAVTSLEVTRTDIEYALSVVSEVAGAAVPALV